MSKIRKTNLKQFAVRLKPDTIAALSEEARSQGIPVAEVIRASIQLYQHARALEAPLRLATVDQTDHKEGYYRLKQWFLLQG